MNNIPGYKEVSEKYGQFNGSDFDEVIYCCHDRYYNEDRELFEFHTTLILAGRLGRIQYDFGNMQMFKIMNSYQITGFRIDDIKSSQWDRKNYKVYDLENESIFGYSENCKISIPASLH